MDARDQLKVMKAGFTIISAIEKKENGINIPVIFYKNKEYPKGNILSGNYNSYSERDIRIKQLLHQELIIQD